MRYVKPAGNGTLQCELCPHSCTLAQDKNGICKVRCNVKGQTILPYYGWITALAKDPIEKKPLYHFRPGTEILSIGFQGCNLRCPFCQNWHISQNTEATGRKISPRELVSLAKGKGQIAYTYSEPLVHIEFLLDCMNEAHKRGIANVLVTNGCINSEAAKEVLALTDAANIDLKCFSKETYSNVLGGDLETVLDFIMIAHNMNVHVEITTLVVPGLNDSKAELDSCIDFIAGLNKETGINKSQIPWHLSAYHPDWKWKAPATTPELLLKTAERARNQLDYVYTGNITNEKNDTLCNFCGKTLVSRHGYRVNTGGIKNKNEKVICASCGNTAPFRV